MNRASSKEKRTSCFPLLPHLAVSALVLGSMSVYAQAPSVVLQPSAQQQMADVLAFKHSFTDAEKKLSSNLVLASRAAQGKPLGSLARFLDAPRRDRMGRFEVEVVGTASPSLMSLQSMGSAQTSAEGGTLPGGKTRLHTRVSGTDLLELASHPDVTSVRESSGAHTNVGSVTSQGYISEGANKVIAGGVNGSGVKVGILSDSASPARVAALIASGDLPSDVVVLPGQAGAGADEGTAMMEIVHDMAPGAKLFFASAFNGESQFAANIRTLRFTYGCDIIVDDVSYFDESVFQDGIVASAVNDVTAAGALYFSSAANSGNISHGSSGTWEGDFTPSGSVFAGESLLNFGTAAAPQNADQLTSPANSGVWLHWADANAKSSNDYDLFIFDSTGATLKGYSANTQDGTQDPLEYVYPSNTCTSAKPTGYCPAAGDLIVVGLYQGDPRAIHIDTERATLSTATSGATFGHNAGQNTVSMAAVYWNSARTGPRPFTGGAANPTEFFSSDGPRKIFYNPDGTPITPGNFLFATNGGTTLIKPDAAAADGVTTRTPGFNPFFGTSAAAPHAAGIAALVKSAAPSLTNVQIRQILTSTTVDNMEPGIDQDSGYGILLAPQAVAAAKAMTQISSSYIKN